jgi:hypothetical protein
MKIHNIALLVSLICGTLTPVFAQDATITNARIVVANGTVIERGSIVVSGGKNRFGCRRSSNHNQWKGDRRQRHDGHARIH